MKLIGSLIVIISIIYLITETFYFGNSQPRFHFLPSSPAEIIADGIGLLICAAGNIIILLADILNKIKS